MVFHSLKTLNALHDLTSESLLCFHPQRYTCQQKLQPSPTFRPYPAVSTDIVKFAKLVVADAHIDTTQAHRPKGV